MTMTDEAPPGLMAGTPRLNKALAAAQAEIPPIAKGETAKVDAREGRRSYSYSYTYADLAAITAAAYPVLGRHGLAFSSRPTLHEGKFVLIYQLLHESGEALDGMMLLPSSGRPQDLGGVITYYKRYAFCAVTGITPGGDDDDAQTSDNEQRFDSPRSAGDAWEAAAPAPPRDRRPANQGPHAEPGRHAPATVPPLDDEDPWKSKIADISDVPEGAAARAEVAELLDAGTIDQARASRLNAVITVRALEIQAGHDARQAARREQPPVAPPPIRAGDQGGRKAEPAPGGEDAEWVKGFYARLAAPDADLGAMQREIGQAVASRKIQADGAGQLSADLRRRRNSAAELVSA